jgi:SseB protein N-terminal domain
MPPGAEGPGSAPSPPAVDTDPPAHRPDPMAKDRAKDSAGVPWSGRTLGAQPFPGDDGRADPALLAALEGGDLTAIVAAWAPSRVLVPIVAVLGEGDGVRAAAAEGHGDASADMALVTIVVGGRKVLPAFTGTAALATWNADARPVPVEAARAAQAAVVEECEAVAVDPGGPFPALLPRPAVWAVAQGRAWVPPAGDVEVLAGVANLVRAVPGVKAHRCEPDGAAGLTVVLGIAPGLAAAQVQEITSRTAQLLAADPVVAERAGSLRLTVRPL